MKVELVQSKARFFPGKSPAYIGDNLLQDEIKLEVVAKRLLWGKFNNAGSSMTQYWFTSSFAPFGAGALVNCAVQWLDLPIPLGRRSLFSCNQTKVHVFI